jgi:hypothetical protein
MAPILQRRVPTDKTTTNAFLAFDLTPLIVDACFRRV